MASWCCVAAVAPLLWSYCCVSVDHRVAVEAGSELDVWRPVFVLLLSLSARYIVDFRPWHAVIYTSGSLQVVAYGRQLVPCKYCYLFGFGFGFCVYLFHLFLEPVPFVWKEDMRYQKI